jgi:hypothetical protein
MMQFPSAAINSGPARCQHPRVPIRFLLCAAVLVVSAAETPPNFEALTRSRLQAAGKDARNTWNQTVSSSVVVVDAGGTRNDAGQWYARELQWCKQARCTADDFAVKNQSSLAVVAYSVTVASEDNTKLFRCTDTYVAANGAWQIVSALQASVTNGLKPRVKIDQATLQSYVGTFSNEASVKFEITLTDGRLYTRKVDDGKPIELIPDSPTTFYVLGDDSITTFIKAESGEVTGVKIAGSNGTSTLTKVK